MSSILIKGAEMPISCTECPCYDDMETCFCNVLDSYCEQYKTERHPDCPLVEIPAPHGRLIEAPNEISYAELYRYNRYDYIGIAEYFANQIRKLPTIIEAEE